MTRGEEAGRTGGERGACLRGPRSILPDGAPAQLWFINPRWGLYIYIYICNTITISPDS